MLQQSILQKSYFSNITPQIRNSKKSFEIERLGQRISLMKRQLKNHRDQTSLDIVRLKQINQKGKQFQKKIIDQIQKCKQLQMLNQGTKNKEYSSDPTKQIKNQNFLQIKKVYNLTDFINKDNSNQKNIIPQQKHILNSNFKQQCSLKDPYQTSKKLKKKVSNNNKNLFFFQKSKAKYLKETFLISILLALIGIVFKSFFINF